MREGRAMVARTQERTAMADIFATGTLTQLGQPTRLPASPDEARLEAVPNPHPGTHYLVRFTAPEFTSLCPITGQPDFAHLVIDYVPRDLLVEVEIVKLYLSSFRYRAPDAVADFAGPLAHQSVDYFKELTFPERKAIHNLKYYTWVEQQGKTSAELTEQWNPEYWRALFEDEVAHFDQLIEAFNQQVRARG